MEERKQKIRSKVQELAANLGHDAAGIGDGDLIGERAGLDSPAILELICWYEGEFGLTIPQEDLTVENFGTISAMAAAVDRFQG